MNGKTIKEMATELDVDKQRVYRFIKRNHIREAYSYNQALYYDANAQNLIKRFFTEGIPLYMLVKESKAEPPLAKEKEDGEVTETLLAMLRNELEVKNKQIEQLNGMLADATANLKPKKGKAKETKPPAPAPDVEIALPEAVEEPAPEGAAEGKEADEPAWEPEPLELPEQLPEQPAPSPEPPEPPESAPEELRDDPFLWEDVSEPIDWGEDQPVSPEKPRKGLLQRLFGR